MKQRLVWRACLEVPPSALLTCLVTAVCVPLVNTSLSISPCCRSVLRKRDFDFDSVCVVRVGSSGFDNVLPSGPDIAQFKQGVKTVAGKMAVLANGVMNTIQVNAHMCFIFQS